MKLEFAPPARISCRYGQQEQAPESIKPGNWTYDLEHGRFIPGTEDIVVVYKLRGFTDAPHG